MPTLTAIRQLAAKEIGPYQSGTSDASGNTTSLLVDSDWPIKTSLGVSNRYLHHFLFIPSNAAADQVRQVATYAPSTGTITRDLVTAAAAQQSQAFELHGVIEPLELHDLINQALKRVFVIVEVVGTPTADKTRHSLGTVASWLTDDDFVRQVGYLSTGETRDETDPFSRVVRGSVERDGDTVYINHQGRSFNATDTLYIRMLKPAYNHCRASGGSYGDQNGLSLETDEASPKLEWIAAATVVETWKRYGNLLEPEADGKLIRTRRDAADWFTSLTAENLGNIPVRTFRPLGSWGPRGSGGGTYAARLGVP